MRMNRRFLRGRDRKCMGSRILRLPRKGHRQIAARHFGQEGQARVFPSQHLQDSDYGKDDQREIKQIPDNCVYFEHGALSAIDIQPSEEPAQAAKPQSAASAAR